MKVSYCYFLDFPLKQLIKDSRNLCNYLYRRHPPTEHNELRQKKSNIESRVYSQYANEDITDLSDEQTSNLKNKLKCAVDMELKTQIYNWKPVNYDVHMSLQYLLGRSAAEYAVLSKIFYEIATRDPAFKPRSLFDFGSGVGTVTW